MSRFSQLDLADAYRQLKLDRDSQPLTTIPTRRGLSQYRGLVFGLKTAPVVFQRAIEQALAGLEGTLVYLDDILVMAPDIETHDSRLLAVLQRLAEWGFRLRLEKCSFAHSSVKYLCVIVSERGIEADPKRVAAIQALKEEVRSLQGLVNYYGEFVDHLHTHKAPLEKLLANEQSFTWTPEHGECLKRIKQLLSGPLFLAHYDPRQTLIVAADASPTEIGGVLLQRYPDGHVKAGFHMAKSLSKAQRNRSQIGEGVLALVTAVEWFKRFIWGRHFVLQTDHQPLVVLFRPSSMKGLSEPTAARLQR